MEDVVAGLYGGLGCGVCAFSLSSAAHDNMALSLLVAFCVFLFVGLTVSIHSRLMAISNALGDRVGAEPVRTYPPAV